MYIKSRYGYLKKFESVNRRSTSSRSTSSEEGSPLQIYTGKTIPFSEKIIFKNLNFVNENLDGQGSLFK